MEVIVVGAGAAGMLAAWRAATLGARVTLLEKTPRHGTKILISGGGKCNITHAGPIENLIRAFRPNEARFIRGACYRFTNDDIVQLLTDRGLRVYTRPDGRIFPVDQTAKDVVRILGSILAEVGVATKFDSPVQSLLVDSGVVTGVRVRERELTANAVIVTVGGSSYPNSGTTGDGWKWCRELGHTIVKPRAALAPIYMHVDQDWVALSGVALRNCVLKAHQGKEFARWRGDLLFTHHGISGPTALGVSREVAERLETAAVSLTVDVLPDGGFESLGEDLIAYGQLHARRRVSTWMEPFLPDRLIPMVLDRAGIAAELPFSALTKKQRNKLVEILKALPLGPVRTVPLEKGEVVSGGVSLSEVDPQTMQSGLARGLYLAGEVLDVAGPVGGYNLQAAFATGYVAGESAVQIGTNLR